jgi:hypothetical protein
MKKKIVLSPDFALKTDFYIKSFYEHFVNKACSHFLNKPKTLDFFIYMTYFKRKKVPSPVKPIFYILDIKTLMQ